MEHPLPAGAEIDRFVVERTLGEGGMAVVYAVRHRELGSLHALKCLQVDNAKLAERLRKEARLQANLRHPHIVAVHDVIVHEGQPCLVMEMVDGVDLDQWIYDHPEADDATRREIARGIAAAVGHAHAHGTVHRDLKPGNVLITDVAGRPFPKVADFGLAKAIGETAPGLTRQGVAIGTPRYMSPEQIRDAKSVDSRTDVFALGAMFYELWTGAPAYEDESIPGLFMAITQGELPDLTPLPPQVADAVRGALVPDRDARIQTCEALITVLDGLPSAPATPSRAPAADPPVVVPDAPDGPQVSEPTLAPEPIGSSEPTSPIASTERPRWLVPALVVGIVAMLAALLLCGGAIGLGLIAGPGSSDATPDDRADPAPQPDRPSPAPPPRPAPDARPSPSPTPSPSPSPRPSPQPPAQPGKGKGKDNPGKSKGHD